MIGNFMIATLMVGLTVTTHFAGLLCLIWLLRNRGHRFRAHESATGQGAAILFIVLGLVAVHTVEIWLYACAYLAVGALPDFESALYFSTASFTLLHWATATWCWTSRGAFSGPSKAPTAYFCSAGRRRSSFL